MQKVECTVFPKWFKKKELKILIYGLRMYIKKTETIKEKNDSRI